MCAMATDVLHTVLFGDIVKSNDYPEREYIDYCYINGSGEHR